MDSALSATVMGVEAVSDGRVVLCVPRGCGLNDVLVQIWLSYQVAVRENRTLLIDTRVSGLWDDFDAYFSPTGAAGVPIVCRVDDRDITQLNTRTCHPEDRTGRLDFMYRQMEIRMAAAHRRSRAARAASFVRAALGSGQGRRAEFLADSLRRVGDKAATGHSDGPHAQDVVVHHRSGGGEQSGLALRLFTFTSRVRTAVREAVARCGPDYAAIHVRNTDMRADYTELLNQAAHRFAGRTVLVCSDDTTVIEASRRALSESRVVTATRVPDSGGRALHHTAAGLPLIQRREAATGAIVDLMALAHARDLMVAPARDGGLSGYSRLAGRLQADAMLRAQLMGEAVASGTRGGSRPAQGGPG